MRKMLAGHAAKVGRSFQEIELEGGATMQPATAKNYTRDDLRAFRKRVARRRAKKGYR